MRAALAARKAEATHDRADADAAFARLFSGLEASLSGASAGDDDESRASRVASDDASRTSARASARLDAVWSERLERDERERLERVSRVARARVDTLKSARAAFEVRLREMLADADLEAESVASRVDARVRATMTRAETLAGRARADALTTTAARVAADRRAAARADAAARDARAASRWFVFFARVGEDLAGELRVSPAKDLARAPIARLLRKLGHWIPTSIFALEHDGERTAGAAPPASVRAFLAGAAELEPRRRRRASASPSPSASPSASRRAPLESPRESPRDDRSSPRGWNACVMRVDAPDALRDVLATLRHGVSLSKPPKAPPASRSLRRPPSGASRASAPSRVDAHVRTRTNREPRTLHRVADGHEGFAPTRLRRRAILDPRVVAWLDDDGFEEDECEDDDDDEMAEVNERRVVAPIADRHHRVVGRAIVVARRDGNGFRDATVGDVENLADCAIRAAPPLVAETRFGSRTSGLSATTVRRRPMTSAETAELAAAYLGARIDGDSNGDSNGEALADARDAWPSPGGDDGSISRVVAFVYDESRATPWGGETKDDGGGERCRRARPAFVAVCRLRRSFDDEDDDEEDDDAVASERSGSASPGRGGRSTSVSGNTGNTGNMGTVARSRGDGDDALDAVVRAGTAVAAISRDAARTAAGSANATAAFASRGRGRRRGDTNRHGEIPAPIDWSARDFRLTRAAEAVDEAEEALGRARRETAALESNTRAASRRRDARVGGKSVTFASEESHIPRGDAFARSG